MAKIPDEHNQSWLLEELGHLVSLHGSARISQGELFLPTAEHFPDPWQGDLDSLASLCKRLFRYTDLPPFEVHLESFAQEQKQRVGLEGVGDWSYRHDGATAWFAGIYGNVVHFGCSEHQLENAGEGIVGVMAHEVAHVWRRFHGLEVADRDDEEDLTDLTTVYLGFGVFTVNNTYRYRSESVGTFGQRMSRSSAGYLSPQEMSWLFAAQLHLRGLGWWQRRGALGWLEPRQRGFTKAAYRALGSADAVRRRMGLLTPR